VTSLKKPFTRVPACTLASICWATAFVLWNSAALGAEPALLSPTVVSIVKSARYCSTGKPEWRALQIGDDLTTGAVLQTSSETGSMVDIGLSSSKRVTAPTIRMFSNSVLKLLKLELKNSGSTQVQEIGLEVTAGKARVIIDGVSTCDFEFNAIVPMHLAIQRSKGSHEPTVFVFDAEGTVTVLKGEVKATGSKPEKVLRRGEQLRNNADDITKLPSDAPELKLFP